MLTTSLVQSFAVDWARMVGSAEARRALARWARLDPLLACRGDLDAVVDTRRDPVVANRVQLVLAGLAPTDVLAARTLLQMLLPGVVALVHTVGRGDRDATDEMVSLAWERICTYPPSRRGSVAANVVLDVRKRYVQDRRRPHVPFPGGFEDPMDPAPGPEDHALAVSLLDELDAARRSGVITNEMFTAIIATRLYGVRVADLAATERVTRQKVHQRRWHGERRLRTIGLAG
jgi:hypothetical protein